MADPAAGGRRGRGRGRRIELEHVDPEVGVAGGGNQLGLHRAVRPGHEEGAGGDRVWSASAGTLFIDAVNGSVLNLRIVGAAMTVPAGAAAGSFTLDVSGQVNTLAHQGP